MKKYRFFCSIYVHYEASNKRWMFLRKLAQDLKLQDIGEITTKLENADYTLKIRDNTYNGNPTFYHDQNLSSNYFNFWITYSPIIPENCYLMEDEFDQLHAGHISKILELLWEQKIPAATFGTVDELLPWQGGNDQSKIFWEDKYKKPKAE